MKKKGTDLFFRLYTNLKRKINLSPFFLFFVFLICSAAIAVLAGRNETPTAEKKISGVEIREGEIYVDGEKFIIKGIGYSPYRPGQTPGSPVPLDTVGADFKRIKEAGFNTLRVWDTMSPTQLELAEKYGLKVMQAVYLDPRADYGYSGFVLNAMTRVKYMCKNSKDHPNIIAYLLMNEPHADAIVKSGVPRVIDFYKKLIQLVKQEDPARPVSMANAYWTLWLDQSMWDVVCFNAYSYLPVLSEDMGYANYIKNIKSLHAPERPLVITEFGLSVSPQGEGGGDYGGNTEEEQAEGVVNCFRQLIESGAAGGCVFEWNDEWWKAGKPLAHDSHPEEWFGIIGIESKSNISGKPRKAYYSLKEEFKLVVTRPQEGARILDKADIEVHVSEGMTGVRYRIDEGKWMALTKEGAWWKGGVNSSALQPGLHALTVKGLGPGKKEITRCLSIIKCNNEKETEPPINIEVKTDKSIYKNGDEIKINARLTDREGAPIKKHSAKMGVFDSTGSFLRRWEGITDENGSLSQTITARGTLKEWYYIYWAAAEIEDYGYMTKEGKIGYVKAEIGEGLATKQLTGRRAGNIKLDGAMENTWLNTDKIEVDAGTSYSEENITSSEDLSAEVRIMWDEKNLYLLADVKDDMPMQNKNKEIDLWNGDCVELFISVNPAKIPERGYSSADFQILIGTNGRMWIPGQAKGGVRNSIPVSSKAIAKKTDKGYILEAKINIANFQEKGHPTAFKAGDILGFDIAIADGDKKGIREGKLIWNGTPDGYKDSKVWGRLKLE